MITNNNNRILVIATALFIVGGLLVIPAIENQDANAANIKERLQKAHDKIQKSLDKIKERLNGDHHAHL